MSTDNTPLKDMLSSPTEWTAREENNLRLETCEMGPFRVIIMQAAIVSLEISYIWAVVDNRDNKYVAHGMHKTSVAAALIGGADEAAKAVQECRDKALAELKRVYEDWMTEQILLGGNGE
jgi:hypothetical protein